MGGDAVGAGVEALLGQLLAQRDDAGDGVLGAGFRVGLGSGGLLLDCVPAAGAPSGDELADPDGGDPVLAGYRPVGLTCQHCLDDDPILRHSTRVNDVPGQGLTKS